MPDSEKSERLSKTRQKAEPNEYKLPEDITQSRTWQKKRVRKSDLARYKEDMLLLHAPEALRNAFESLCAMARKKDLGAIRLILEVFGYVERRGGVSFTQQIINAVNANQLDLQRAIGFDQFVRAVAEARRNAQQQSGTTPALEAPDNSHKDQIPLAEFVELASG